MPTLWYQLEPRRFFLLPDEALAPPGEVEIHSFRGAHTHAEPAWLAGFEVGEAEARAHLEAALRGGIRHLLEAAAEGVRKASVEGGSSGLSRLGAALRAAARSAADAPDQTGEADTSNENTPEPDPAAASS